MIYAAVTFKFDGKSWRCIDFFPMQASFMLGDVDKEMKAWPAIKTVYMRRMFGKALRRGQFCAKPHKYMGATA